MCVCGVFGFVVWGGCARGPVRYKVYGGFGLLWTAGFVGLCCWWGVGGCVLGMFPLGALPEH